MAAMTFSLLGNHLETTTTAKSGGLHVRGHHGADIEYQEAVASAAFTQGSPSRHLLTAFDVVEIIINNT